MQLAPDPGLAPLFRNAAQIVQAGGHVEAAGLQALQHGLRPQGQRFGFRRIARLIIGGGKPDQGIRHREAAFAAALDQRGQSRSSQPNAFVMAAHGLKNEGKILLCAQTGGMSVPKLPAQYLPCLAQRFDRFLAAVQGVQASAHALQQQGTAGRGVPPRIQHMRERAVRPFGVALTQQPSGPFIFRFEGIHNGFPSCAIPMFQY